MTHMKVTGSAGLETWQAAPVRLLKASVSSCSLAAAYSWIHSTLVLFHRSRYPHNLHQIRPRLGNLFKIIYTRPKVFQRPKLFFRTSSDQQLNTAILSFFQTMTTPKLYWLWKCSQSKASKLPIGIFSHLFLTQRAYPQGSVTMQICFKES